MKRIVYISKETTPLGVTGLADLLDTARRENTRHSITGALFYSAGNFIQVFEGPDEKVDQLYTNIKADPRHQNVQTLFEGPVVDRLYPMWWMAFFNMSQSVDVPEEIKARLLGLIQGREQSLDSVNEVLEQFRRCVA